MQKDFKNWHDKKSQIDQIIKRPFFHLREVWFCYMGINVGFEQDGKGDDFLRPVVIIRKFNNEIFWGIPLTSTIKNSKYYFPITLYNQGTGSAILSQIKLIDARRLSYKIGDISETEFSELTKKLKELIP